MPRQSLPETSGLTNIVLRLLVLFAVASTPLSAQHFPDDALVDSIIQGRVEEGRGTGIVLGLLEADGTHRIYAVGDAGPGARPLGPKSVFEIGSISKAFTGILLADMSMRGEVKLDDPAQSYLPDGVTMPSRPGQTITLEHLSTHRSALPRMPSNMRPADPSNPYADYTPQQMYSFLSDHELTRDVGELYEYSNLGTGLLGHVLALRFGADYESLVRDRILEPLGMNMTGIVLHGDMLGWLAKGHGQNGNVVSNWDIPTFAGAGALHSNIEDMLTFLEANVGEPTGDLEAAMRLSHEEHQTASGNMSVGLNWHILNVGDDRIVWHNGGTGGYRTFIGFDPDRQVGAVVLTNSAHSADDIGFHLVNRTVPLSQPPGPEPTEVEVSRESLDAYVGVYQLAPEFHIAITLEADGLHLQATGQPKFPIFAESESKFFLRVVDAQVTFVRDAAGEVNALILHQGGQNQRAEKIR